MKLSTRQVAKIAQDLRERLGNIATKIDVLSKEEFEVHRRSNFSLEFDARSINSLEGISQDLSDGDSIVIETEETRRLAESFGEFEERTREFTKLVDSIKASSEGSLNESFFYTPYSTYVNELLGHLMNVHQEFLEKFAVLDLIRNKKKYDEIDQMSVLKANEIDAIYRDSKKSIDDLILSLQQTGAAKKVEDIKTYYSDYLRDIKKDRDFYGRWYSGTVVILVLLFLLPFLPDFLKLDIDLSSIVSPFKLILFSGLIGLVTFVMNDFRKRFNISKSIIDDVNQKAIVVDTYSSLLEKVREFDDETKKRYNSEILKSITDSLLAIKSRGYLAKDFHDSTPNIPLDLLNRLIDKIKK